jgi:hypothetical protein
MPLERLWGLTAMKGKAAIVGTAFLLMCSFLSGGCGNAHSDARGIARVRVYVPIALPAFHLAYKPTKFIIAADGSEILTGIHYRGYGRPRANGSASLQVDDCVPGCANGRFHSIRATVIFREIRQHRRKHVYTALSLVAPRAARFNHCVHQVVDLLHGGARCKPS